METSRSKPLPPKEWVSKDGLSSREMEWCMDAGMFVDEYPHWEARGLHHPLILQEMFLQATHSGWKEVKWMIHQGHQDGLLHLDPQVDISTVQLVGYQKH